MCFFPIFTVFEPISLPNSVFKEPTQPVLLSVVQLDLIAVNLSTFFRLFKQLKRAPLFLGEKWLTGLTLIVSWFSWTRKKITNTGIQTHSRLETLTFTLKSPPSVPLTIGISCVLKKKIGKREVREQKKRGKKERKRGRKAFMVKFFLSFVASGYEGDAR